MIIQVRNRLDVPGVIGPPPSGNQRLGLHVTNAELAIWQDRAVNGPYKTAGDVSTNSPGCWDRIVSESTQSMSAERWDGYTGAGCVPTSPIITPTPRGRGDPIICAAYRYLVQGDTTYRTSALNEILAQAVVAGVDFGNSAKWCVGPFNQDNWFDTSQWLVKYIYAYDYLLAGDTVYGGSISAGDRTTIESWFLDGATYMEACVDNALDLYYTDRKNDDYSLTAEGTSRCNSDFRIRWFGDTAIKTQLDNWSNRTTALMHVYAMVGIQQNNSTLKTEAKRYFKEMIRLGTKSDNAPSELHRWLNTNPGLGLVYAFTAWGIASQVADAFARIGDYELVDYSTSDGACGSSGGPKTLHALFTYCCNLCDHTLLKYGTDQAGNNGNADYLIDTDDPIAGNNMVLDHVMAQPNLYYNDSYIQSIYKRTASGTTAYPASPATGGYYAWGNAWGIQPGSLFMFGQMEGAVDPYP